MGLNDSFSNVRGRILLMDPLPPINKVYSLVVQEERLREICSVSITAHVAEPMTLAANTKSSFARILLEKIHLCAFTVGSQDILWTNAIKFMDTPGWYKF